MWLIVIAAAVTVWILYTSWYWMKQDAEPPRLVGEGAYRVEIVGKSNYVASFEKICGKRTADCINRKRKRASSSKITTNSTSRQCVCRSKATQ
jgi:hypothetical protein